MKNPRIAPKRLAREARRDLDQLAVFSKGFDAKLEHAFEQARDYGLARAAFEQDAHPLKLSECTDRGNRGLHGALPLFSNAGEEIRTLKRLCDD